MSVHIRPNSYGEKLFLSSAVSLPRPVPIPGPCKRLSIMHHVIVVLGLYNNNNYYNTLLLFLLLFYYSYIIIVRVMRTPICHTHILLLLFLKIHCRPCNPICEGLALENTIMRIIAVEARNIQNTKYNSRKRM